MDACASRGIDALGIAPVGAACAACYKVAEMCWHDVHRSTVLKGFLVAALSQLVDACAGLDVLDWPGE